MDSAMEILRMVTTACWTILSSKAATPNGRGRPSQIYEEDFLGFSYGFRPGRSQHQALDALSYALLKKKVNYILDADIRGFFDHLDRKQFSHLLEPGERKEIGAAFRACDGLVLHVE